ncbi:MAG: four helix bundle protein [Anaerolineae bacterium]|nr:four helix bundle protein [Anaerolineae bacterium]
MNYDDWVKTVPNEITGDSLWKVEAYRLALFLSEICWHDVSKLVKDKRTRSLADQLYRAVGSISANIAEGYSKSTGRDRARFYEYSLGSARESRDWYYKAHHILSEDVFNHRMSLTTQIIRLLLKMVPQQRKSKGIREEDGIYETNTLQDIHNAPML